MNQFYNIALFTFYIFTLLDLFSNILWCFMWEYMNVAFGERVFGALNAVVERVCVDEGWLKQPHLARVRLIGLWGWVRLHSCCALSNHQTLRERCMATRSTRLQTLKWGCLSTPPSCCIL
jgi:hypothetical protein